jgi:hypothetical protein
MKKSFFDGSYRQHSYKQHTLNTIIPGALAFLLVTILITVGIQGNIAAQEATEAVESAETVDAPLQTAGESGKVLVWVGGGASAESKPVTTTSELGYLDARGGWQKLMNLPAAFAGAYPCGDRAQSPDGRRFTFIVHQLSGGVDGGVLYQISDAGLPVQIGDGHALTCIGGDPFQYSPDSQRLAYIDFNYNENRSDVSGALRVVDSATLTQIGQYGSVASFYLTNDRLFFTQYYNAANGSVSEIAVMSASVVAGADATAQEVTTLFASPGCNYTSSQITAVFGKLAVLVAESCGSNRQWQLYTLNRDGGALENIGEVTGSARFYINARTNWLLPSWDDRHLLFAVPDGNLRYTASIYTLPFETGSPDIANRVELVSEQARFPTYTYSQNRLPSSDTAFPHFSPDGRYWTMVEVRGGRSILHLIDRAQPTRVLQLMDSPMPVTQLFFSPDSHSLYANIGQFDGTANELRRWDLQALSATEASAATEEPAGAADQMESTLVAEGAFGRMVMYPDGRAAAAIIWQRGTDSRQTPYQTLARISLEDGSVIQQLLGEANMVVYNATTGNVSSQRFVYPLVALEASPSAPSSTPTAP